VPKLEVYREEATMCVLDVVQIAVSARSSRTFTQLLFGRLVRFLAFGAEHEPTACYFRVIPSLNNVGPRPEDQVKMVRENGERDGAFAYFRWYIGSRGEND